MLTLDCASPEQIRGEMVTTSTDIYSLGILLFELLTGRPPWKFTSAAEAEQIICNTAPPKPSAANSAIAGDLDNIVLMALRKDPDGVTAQWMSSVKISADIRRAAQ